MRVAVTYLLLSMLAPALSGSPLPAAGGQAVSAELQAWAKGLAPDRHLVLQVVEMLEVDGVNRLGRLRVEATGETNRFAMLPEGTVQYRGGYTDIRYVPVGARMLAFIQRDEEKKITRVYHLVDDLAQQIRLNQSSRLEQVKRGETTLLTVSSGQTEFAANNDTVIWKGTEKGTLNDLQAGQEVKINFQPKSKGANLCSEIWLGTASIDRAIEQTRTNYVRYLTLRGLPAQVGATTRNTLEITLYAGADSSLRTQFKEGSLICIAAADERLRTYGQGVDRVAANVEKVELSKNSLGEEIVKLTCQARVMLEGFRPGRSVRAWAEGWPVHELPREERLYPWDLFNLPDIGGLPKEPMLTLPFALPIPRQ
ncbi:MAG TPA: hypothetical protein VGH19_23740 [Verrucomicrobiae bacterium]